MKTRNLKFKLVIILVILSIVTSTLNFHKVDAKISSNLPVSYIDDNFPDSYKPYIDALKQRHPSWIFKAVHTGLDWNTVLSHETYEVNMGISLVEDIFGSEWKKDGVNYYQDGRFVTASKQGVAYVLDPRNFISEDGIFQFEALRFVGSVQTVNAVQSILSATAMGGEYKSKYKYYGEWKNLGTTYAELIHSLSKQVGINPVHIASRIRQENSGNIINGSLIDGRYGIYNFFNIGAYDANGKSAIENGRAYAESHGWTNVKDALAGGISYIYNQYVKWGQNTIYFERFDVNNPGTAQWLLGTGYMTNIFGAKTEASMSYSAYENAGMTEAAFEFDIPVYNNMPSEPASMPLPGGVWFESDNTKVYLDDPRDSGVVDEFWIRSGPDTFATITEKIYERKDGQENRTKFTRIGIGHNTLYDKVQYEDGRIGYVLKQWIYEYKYTKVKSISLNTTYENLNIGDSINLVATVKPNNATDKSVKWTTSNKDIASVDKNGKVTALKSGIATITATTNDQGKKAICTINVSDTKVDGISLGSSEYTLFVGNKLTLTPTITPAEASNREYTITLDNNTVAKVEGKTIVALKEGTTVATFKTDDGGYTAKATIKVITNEEGKSITVKKDLVLENNIISGVELGKNTVADIKKNIQTDYDMKFVSIDNKTLNDEDIVGTGTKIQFRDGNKLIIEYEIVIYGDVDGTGMITARDLLVLQRYINKKLDLEPIQVKAAIINKTNPEPRAVDLLKIQRHINGKYVIEQ